MEGKIMIDSIISLEKIKGNRIAEILGIEDEYIVYKVMGELFKSGLFSIIFVIHCEEHGGNLEYTKLSLVPKECPTCGSKFTIDDMMEMKFSLKRI